MGRNHSVSNPALLAITPMRELDAEMLGILRSGQTVVAADLVRGKFKFALPSVGES